MSRRRDSNPSLLVTDHGVLESIPTLEVFGAAAVAAVGGVAVLPHRGRWLQARNAGLEARGWFDGGVPNGVRQAVVHLQKGRAATQLGVVEAWHRLAVGGRLLLVGGNDLGVKSAVKRLAAELGTAPEIVANRARARVACWHRDRGAGPTSPASPVVELGLGGEVVYLTSAPGVFSAGELDPGSALLLAHLDRLDPPERVFDPGCGIGVLGLAALHRWSDTTAVLADVDHRAVACARTNADRLGVAARCEIMWWDALSEPPPEVRCDLAVVNPPFHSGVPVDLQPARSIFRALEAVLPAGGRALIVANRTLPWERDLGALGNLRQIGDQAGYKLLAVSR